MNGYGWEKSACLASGRVMVMAMAYGLYTWRGLREDSKAIGSLVSKCNERVPGSQSELSKLLSKLLMFP